MSTPLQLLSRSRKFRIADASKSWNADLMEQLSPVYLSALASQLAALSAFLGGFAATFLATLLTLGNQSKLMTITIGFAVISSVSFIVTVVAATMLTALYHPAAPQFMATAAFAQPQATMGLGFMIGTLSLLSTLGCSGWTRSLGAGWITTTVALLGAAFIISMTVQVR